MISNSQKSCSLNITECMEIRNKSSSQYYNMTICTVKNCTLDSKTTQVPSSPTSMAISETPLIKYVTVCPPVSYQTPSPCLTDMLPVSKSQESKATAVSTATESLNIREKVIYSVGAVAIALLLGTNISLCVALWIKRNQLNKSELFSCFETQSKYIYIKFNKQAQRDHLSFKWFRISHMRKTV